MSSSTDTRSHPRSNGCGSHQRGCGGNWSGLNIAAMVIGFVFFWPIGLFLLIWMLLGRDVRELPDAIHRQWTRMTGAWHGEGGTAQGASDNVVFDEYQQAQYERVREIKEEIKARARRFRDFRANAKRRADEEEFDRFMGEAPARE